MRERATIDWFNHPKRRMRLWHVTPSLALDRLNPSRSPLLRENQILLLSQTVRPNGSGVALAVKTCSGVLVGYAPDEFRRAIVSHASTHHAHVTVFEYNN